MKTFLWVGILMLGFSGSVMAAGMLDGKTFTGEIGAKNSKASPQADEFMFILKSP